MPGELTRAVIDIGSSSVRVLADGRAGRYYERIVTLLGQGVDASRALSAEAMERTLGALSHMAEKAREMGACEIRAFATSAVRDASNREVFLERVRELGIIPEILCGGDEALIAYLGAASGKGTEWVIDIGGGSAETVAGENGGIIFRESRKIGSVRALERSGIGAPATAEDVARLDAICAEAFAGLRRPDGPVRCYAVGSSACSLAAMELCLAEYKPEAVHGHELKTESVLRLRDTLAAFNANERLSRFPSLDKGTVYTIVAGASVHLAFMRMSGINTLTVSVRGNLEGYLKLPGRNII